MPQGGGPGGSQSFGNPKVGTIVWYRDSNTGQYVRLAWTGTGWVQAPLQSGSISDGPTVPGGGSSSSGGSGGSNGGGGGISVLSGYEHLAALYGQHVTGAELTALQVHNVSLSEFQDRLEAVKRVNEYKPALDSFAFQTGRTMNAQQRLAFVLGQSSHDFYADWERISIGTSFLTAGANLSEKPTGRARGGESDVAIGHHEVRRIANELPGIQTEEAVQRLAEASTDMLAKLMPSARAAGLRLSRNDVIRYNAGTGDVETNAKIKRLLDEQAAFAQSRPRSEFQTGQGGPTNASLAGISGGEQSR